MNIKICPDCNMHLLRHTRRVALSATIADMPCMAELRKRVKIPIERSFYQMERIGRCGSKQGIQASDTALGIFFRSGALFPLQCLPSLIVIDQLLFNTLKPRLCRRDMIASPLIEGRGGHLFM
jgi:hypothetical protein